MLAGEDVIELYDQTTVCANVAIKEVIYDELDHRESSRERFALRWFQSRSRYVTECATFDSPVVYCQIYFLLLTFASNSYRLNLSRLYFLVRLIQFNMEKYVSSDPDMFKTTKIKEFIIIFP